MPQRKLMWISRCLSSVSNIKVVLHFYFFFKVLFIWTLRDNVQLDNMPLKSHFEFWHWIPNSSQSVIGSCGFPYSHRSIPIFLWLLYKIHVHTMLIVSAPTASSPMARSVKCHNLVILFIYTTHCSFKNTPEVVKQPLSLKKKITEIIPNSKDFKGNKSNIFWLINSPNLILTEKCCWP